MGCILKKMFLENYGKRRIFVIASQDSLQHAKTTINNF